MNEEAVAEDIKLFNLASVCESRCSSHSSRALIHTPIFKRRTRTPQVLFIISVLDSEPRFADEGRSVQLALAIFQCVAVILQTILLAPLQYCASESAIYSVYIIIMGKKLISIRPKEF